MTYNKQFRDQLEPIRDRALKRHRMSFAGPLLAHANALTVVQLYSPAHTRCKYCFDVDYITRDILGLLKSKGGKHDRRRRP